MKKQIISFTLLAAGFLIGATALSAMADWSPAPGTPPNNNVPAPINVGNGIPRLNTAGVQEKTDSFNIDGNLGVLGLGAFNNLAVTGNLNVYAGASTTANTVLANDGSGNAKWVATSTLGLGGGSSSGVTQIKAGTNITISPSGGTGVVTINSSSGGSSGGAVSGTVGGGCYYVSSGIYKDWGNATAAIYPNVYSCTCPSGYYKAITTHDFSTGYANTVSVDNYLCLAQ